MTRDATAALDAEIRRLSAANASLKRERAELHARLQAATELVRALQRDQRVDRGTHCDLAAKGGTQEVPAACVPPNQPTETRKRSTRPMIVLNPGMHTRHDRSTTATNRPTSRAEYDEHGRCKAVSGVIDGFASPSAR